jgi:fused signal recognition particle receptor
MKKIVRVSNPDLVILVVDSLTGNDAVEQARTFASAVKLDGIILTKLDADAKGGSAISISSAIGVPVMFAGVGQTYNDLVSFDGTFVISRIID